PFDRHEFTKALDLRRTAHDEKQIAHPFRYREHLLEPLVQLGNGHRLALCGRSRHRRGRNGRRRVWRRTPTASRGVVDLDRFRLQSVARAGAWNHAPVFVVEWHGRGGNYRKRAIPTMENANPGRLGTISEIGRLL